MRVVRRSSCSSTGTPSPSRRAEARGELLRLARLRGVLTRERERQADDDPLDLTLGHERRQRLKPAAGAGRWIVSIGVTIVPVGSASAQPQRALP